MADSKKVLDLEQLGYYDGKIKAKIATDDATTLKSAKDYTDEKVGDLSTLKTTVKDNGVTAINELFDKIDASVTSGALSIDTTQTTEGMAKSYTIKQGEKTIGTIDVPKDMVVSSGELQVLSETDAAGHTVGTYLVLTLANATSDKVWVNLDGLVDTYTAAQSATQIQLAIDANTREISATIIAGSVTATEIATDAITTEKIADKNVTKDKLADDVQESLGKADSAVQKVVESATNGTISVDGTDVAVHGLASGAYTDIDVISKDEIDALFTDVQP